MSDPLRQEHGTKSIASSQSSSKNMASPNTTKGCPGSAMSSAKTSFSEDSAGGGGWFGDIKSLAKSTKDSIFPTIDGIASMIHRSALTVAAEIAQLERDAEMEADRWREENYGNEGSPSRQTRQAPLRLPWQVKPQPVSLEESMYDEDEAFKLRILELSTTEDTFLEPYGVGEADDFPLTEQRIQLIRRLLDIDENLAATHAKLSGRSDVKEALFWKNYFHHCDRLRMEYDDLVDIDVASRSTLGSLIPANDGDSSYQPDEGSYICVRNGIASPPSSLNTLTDTLSVGDLVVVGADGSEFNELDLGKSR